MMVRRLHASLLVTLLPIVMIRLSVDQQRAREYVQQTASITELTLMEHLLGEMNQSQQGDSSLGTGTDSAIDEKLDEPPNWTHQNVSSVAEPIDMNDLDPSKRATCGFIQCYFRSNSDSQVGYVVAPASKKTAGRLKSLMAAWKLAEQLRREHDMEPFSLGSSSKHICNQRAIF